MFGRNYGTLRNKIKLKYREKMRQSFKIRQKELVSKRNRKENSIRILVIDYTRTYDFYVVRTVCAGFSSAA